MLHDCLTYATLIQPLPSHLPLPSKLHEHGLTLLTLPACTCLPGFLPVCVYCTQQHILPPCLQVPTSLLAIWCVAYHRPDNNSICCLPPTHTYTYLCRTYYTIHYLPTTTLTPVATFTAQICYPLYHAYHLPRLLPHLLFCCVVPPLPSPTLVLDSFACPLSRIYLQHYTTTIPSFTCRLPAYYYPFPTTLPAFYPQHLQVGDLSLLPPCAGCLPSHHHLLWTTFFACLIYWDYNLAGTGCHYHPSLPPHMPFVLLCYLLLWGRTLLPSLPPGPHPLPIALLTPIHCHLTTCLSPYLVPSFTIPCRIPCPALAVPSLPTVGYCVLVLLFFCLLGRGTYLPACT